MARVALQAMAALQMGVRMPTSSVVMTLITHRSQSGSTEAAAAAAAAEAVVVVAVERRLCVWVPMAD